MAVDGVRFGEVQLMATGVLLSVAGIAFTYARPVNELAPVQPLPSVFHPAVALSTIGQLAIHLATMVVAVRWAREAATGNEVRWIDRRKEEENFLFYLCMLLNFKFLLNFKILKVVTSPYEPEFLKLMLAASGSPASKKFKPALLNTVVFLVETAQQVAVMTVNYKGRPFMLASTVSL